jgi:MerR-like DNA binding protein
VVRPSSAATGPHLTIISADAQRSSGALAPESWYRNCLPSLIPVPKQPGTQYLRDMKGNRRTTYRISEAARELGISAEWLRVGEKRGYFPPALRDRNGHRYYTEEDMERMRNRPTSRRTRDPVSESPEVGGGESGGSETVGESPKGVSDCP